MKKDSGQNIVTWNDTWKALTPESEIQMWDFYGLRQWILKYAPRYGKSLEAGCGLGRYVFYLSKLGIDIEGIDFSVPTVKLLNEWKVRHNFSANFIKGDVTDLPFEDNSLSGYISLGVIEHFIDGPHRPLKEAYRVLRPGGIAIISTPSISFNIFLEKIKKKIKVLIKKIVRFNTKPETFYQYWYRPGKLKNFVQKAGLKVVQCSGADLLYAFCERGRFTGNNLREGTFAYKFSHKFENNFFSTIGAQSITISVKIAQKMHCFLCGEKNADEHSLSQYDVPICKKCLHNELSIYYKKSTRPVFASSYIMNPTLKPPTKEKCEYCEKEYISHPIFEDFGFLKMVCTDCLKIPKVNIVLSNTFVKPVWRKREV